MKKVVKFLIPLFICSIGGVACSKVERTKASINNPNINIVDDVVINVSSYKIGHEKEKMNDGNYDTYWEAANKDNAVISLDLKENRILKNVTQVFAEDDIWYFKIEGSLDNQSFFTLLDNSFGVYGKVFSESINGSARYIKLTIIKSEKGKFPSSKEFYVQGDKESDGINVALGLKGNCSSHANNFSPSNVFDGDYGTYWCRDNSPTFPLNLTGTWKEAVYAKSIEITLQDYALYDFEILVTKEGGSEEVVASRMNRTGNFFKFNLAAPIKITDIKYRVYSDAINPSTGEGYWASAAEIKVIGLKEISSEIGNCDCYVDFIKSKNGIKDIHSVMKNIDGISSEDEVYGYPLANVLNYNFGGKINSYFDENHYITAATKPDISPVEESEISFYKGEKIGEICHLTFDLGKTSILTHFLQEFNESSVHKFYIESSLDDQKYDLIYAKKIEEPMKEYICPLQNNVLARYVRLTIIPDENSYATSNKFYIYGYGSSVRENWWQNTSGVIRFYPKLQPTTLREITERLDEFRYSGYRVIELHQPYEGVANIWAGLGGTDNYQIDPIIGNFIDLQNLLTQAHAKGMKVFMFGNVGYGKYNSDIFLKAAKDYGMGIASKESKLFRFSKTKPTKKPGQDPNDPHLDPNRWFFSDLANAYYYEYWQRGGDIPTFNFENKEWQEECANYINFWANIGMDGIALDAPSVYDFGEIPEGGSEREQYEKRCSDITFDCITRTLRENNLFSIPEGNGETKYIGDYKYRAVQNYNMTSWGGGAQSLGIIAAREHKGAKDLDKWVKSVHDEAVGLGGVAVNGMNFEDVYDDATSVERILESALVTTTGHMSFLHLGSDAKIGQDIMKKWPLQTQLKVAQSFALQNSLSSLNPSGERKILPTNDDSKYYAFYRADMNSNNKAIVVFNYQNEDATINITVNACSFIKSNNMILYDAFNDETLSVACDNGVINIPCKANSHRVLIAR